MAEGTSALVQTETQLTPGASVLIQSFRMELADLKRCQVTYFSLAVTATGAILGFATTAASPSLRALGMMAPLALLLPCWLIFFDKATTITRIVGLQRAIEKAIIAATNPPRWLFALETAMAIFRRAQDKKLLKKYQKPPDPPSLWNVLLLGTRHRYWMLNWYTYCLLSLVCCVVSYNFAPVSEVGFRLPGIPLSVPQRLLLEGPAFVLTLFVAIYTFGLVLSLVHGSDSYDANSLAWDHLTKLPADDLARIRADLGLL